MGKKDDADLQKSAAVLQAEIDEKIALGVQSQAIDIHAYKLPAIPEGVWAVRTLRRLLLQNNLLEVGCRASAAGGRRRARICFGAAPRAHPRCTSAQRGRVRLSACLKARAPNVRR